MQRRKTGFEINLDSLLDTMTNVVGILVILLAMTQLSVRHTIGQIKAMGFSQVPNGEFKKEFEDLKRRRDSFKEELNKILPQAEQTSNELKNYENLDELKSLIETQTMDQYPNKRMIEAEIAKLKRQRKFLREQIISMSSQIDEKNSLIAQKYPEGPKFTDVHVPAIIPASSDLKPVYFVCRWSKVWPINYDLLMELTLEAMKTATGQQETPILLNERNADLMEEYFRDHDVGDEHFRLTIHAVRSFLPSIFGSSISQLYVEVKSRNPSQWETIRQMKAPDSVFRETLKSFNPKKQFMMFFVWSDSFGTYDEAIKIAEEILDNFKENWRPVAGNQELRIGLGESSSGSRPRGPQRERRGTR